MMAARCALRPVVRQFPRSLTLVPCHVARWNHGGSSFDFLKERNRFESLLSPSPTSSEASDEHNSILYVTQSDWEQHLEKIKQESTPEYEWITDSPPKGVIRVPPSLSSPKPQHLLRFCKDFDDTTMRSLTTNMADLVSYIKDAASKETYTFESLIPESLLSDNDLEECVMSFLLSS